jgi:ribosomal protein S18 acetylase RimI-like enzyme
MNSTVSEQAMIRRKLRDGDADAIVELHRRVYCAEYGMNDAFVASVRRAVQAAAFAGWPQRSGAVWLVEQDGEVRGALALTDEGEGIGRVRLFVLDPALRGRGLGAFLLRELLARARADGLRKLELETFSELTVAARLYRAAGFKLVWEREQLDWGPPVTYQRYELEPL